MDEFLFFFRPENKCLLITDPTTRRSCRCHQCLPSTNRLSTFIPFHRRPRTTPPALTDPSSMRTKIEPNKCENASDTLENNNNSTTQNEVLISQSTSSPIVNNPTPLNQPATNEKPNEWTASTPNSVGISGPPSVLAPITNLNSLQTNSPAPLTTSSSSRGLKRSATMAFDDLSIVEDDEREQHKQTYDFHRTDTFLQLPLKRFRSDVTPLPSSLTIKHSSSAITTDHVYQHGQPTPPSPSHLLSRGIDPYEFDDREELTSRLNYPPSTPTNNTRHNQSSSSFYSNDGPSMADLETILDSHDSNENKNSNVLSHILSNGGVKSPMRKDNSLPSHSNLTATIAAAVAATATNGNAFHINKSLNGGMSIK